MKLRMKVYELPAIIRQVVREFALHPYDINNGLCDQFVVRVSELCPDIEELVIEEGCHYCIKYDGKYYDAEEPEGVLKADQLPIMVRGKRRDSLMGKP